MSNSNTTPQPARSRQITLRQYRVVKALLNGAIMREDADRIAGASNSPHIISELRKLGLNIGCELIPSTDRDGNHCYPGRYSLPPESRKLARELLGIHSSIIAEGTG